MVNIITTTHSFEAADGTLYVATSMENSGQVKHRQVLAGLGANAVDIDTDYVPYIENLS